MQIQPETKRSNKTFPLQEASMLLEILVNHSEYAKDDNLTITAISVNPAMFGNIIINASTTIILQF